MTDKTLFLTFLPEITSYRRQVGMIREATFWAETFPQEKVKRDMFMFILSFCSMSSGQHTRCSVCTLKTACMDAEVMEASSSLQSLGSNCLSWYFESL